MLLQQVVERQWPAGAVHDTIRAVIRDPAFFRSVRNSIADRMLIWLLDALDRLGKAFKHLPSGRNLGLTFVGLLVFFLLARLVIAARQSDETRSTSALRRGATVADDPWHAADVHASAGRYDDAAHALYRAVILSLARAERLRVDPSKTSGDYARELRRRGSSSLMFFRAFTQRFDVIVYGHERATRETFEELLKLSTPFRHRAVAA